MDHFIETVHKYPCLWNTTAIEYRDQELKDAAWTEVMKETDLSSGERYYYSSKCSVARRGAVRVEASLRLAVGSGRSVAGRLGAASCRLVKPAPDTHNNIIMLFGIQCRCFCALQSTY